MYKEALIEIAPTIAYFLIFTTLIYVLLYLLLIKKTKHLPTVLGDIGWKRVDYIWIIAGSLGVVTQIIQIQAQIVSTELSTQRTLDNLASMNLNRAAFELSDSSVCLTRTEEKKSNFRNLEKKELMRACKKFKEFAPNSPNQIELKIAMILNKKEIEDSAENYKTPLIKTKIESFKKAFAAYEKQLNETSKINNKAIEYNRVIQKLIITTPIILAIAIALRLAKVTGEIRLKKLSDKKSQKSNCP
ncbi:hypothetical protein [Pseudomonas oryzihabitans]|uniref:hypothetical protein n=1 Tax=Pseudomonas oryzihabitans TaxID=47885 RepID=UPI00111D40B8|nr:hypothetical protein [Pseudomonas psychrotolerans]